MKEDKLDITGYLLIAFIALWIWFTGMIAAPNIKNNLRFFSYFYGKSYEEKLKALDGDFYSFMQFCKANIPEDKSVFFHNQESKYEKSHGRDALLMALKHREKSGYYLYPRKVYMLPYSTKISDDVSYVILDGVTTKIDGFEPFLEYSANQYILKRTQEVRD